MFNKGIVDSKDCPELLDRVSSYKYNENYENYKNYENYENYGNYENYENYENYGKINDNSVPKVPCSPLFIPKIGISKGTPTTPSQILKPGENPWVYIKSETNNSITGLLNPSDIKITAITPIGTIAMVPTCDIRPPLTPRKLPPTPTRHIKLNIMDENTGSVRIDPLLTTTIYLDCTKPSDQDYNHVSQRMRDITANTLTLQKQYSTTLRPLINVIGKVSHETFEDALSVYENNQVYYQDRIDDKVVDIETVKICLTQLEHWFACIIEPEPVDDIEAWKERELSKVFKGLSPYCDPELHKYIQPLPSNLRTQIRQSHVGLI
jgi:hypothetical protein